MAHLLHSAQSPSDGIHVIHAYYFADSVSMDALNDAYKGVLSLATEDIGKVAYRESDASFWALATISPLAWTSLSFSGSHSDLTNLNADDHTQYILVNGTRAFTGAIDIGGNKVQNVADPTIGTDAVTLSYFNSNAATGRNITAQSSNYTATSADIVLMNTSSGNLILTLPSANTSINNFIDIKKTSNDGYRIDVTAQSGEAIDGIAARILDGYNDAVTLTSDGSNWYLI